MIFSNKLRYILIAVLSLILLVSCSGEQTVEHQRVEVPRGLIIPYGELARLVVPHDSLRVSLTAFRLPDETWQAQGAPDAQLMGILPQGRRLVITPPGPQQQTTRYLLHLEKTNGDLFQMVVFISNPFFGHEAAGMDSRSGSEGEGEDSSHAIKKMAEAVGLPAELAEAAIEGGMSIQEFIDFVQNMQLANGDDLLTDSRTLDRVAGGHADGVLADQLRDFFNIPDGVADKADAGNIVWVAKTISELGGDPGDRSWYEDFGSTVRDHLGVPHDATKDMDVNDILGGMVILQQTGSDINDPGAWETLIDGQRQGKSDQEIARALMERNKNETEGTPGMGIFGGPSGSSSSTTGINTNGGDSNSSQTGSSSSDSDVSRPDSGNYSSDGSNDSSSQTGQDTGSKAVVLAEGASYVVYISDEGTTWVVDKNTGEVTAQDSNMDIIDPPPPIPGVSDDDSANDSNDDSNDNSNDNSDDDSNDDSDDDSDDDDDGDDDSNDNENDGDEGNDNENDGENDSDDEWPVADWYHSPIPVWVIIAKGEMQLDSLSRPAADYEGGNVQLIFREAGFGVIDHNPDYEGSGGSYDIYIPVNPVADYNPDYESGSVSLDDHIPGSDVIDPADPNAGISGGSDTHLGGTGEGIFLCVGELRICSDFSEFRCCPATNEYIDTANVYVSEHEGQHMFYWNYGGDLLVCLEDQFVTAYQSVCNDEPY